MVPPKLIPLCQSDAASGTFPTEQTKLMKAMNGAIRTFSIVEINPCPVKKSRCQKVTGIIAVAIPATRNPIKSSVRIMVKSPIVYPAASPNFAPFVTSDSSTSFIDAESLLAKSNRSLPINSFGISLGNRSHKRRIITVPPTNSATANCQPIKIQITIPSSITKFVEAKAKIIDVVKSAPLKNSVLLNALAA